MRKWVGELGKTDKDSIGYASTRNMLLTAALLYFYSSRLGLFSIFSYESVSTLRSLGYFMRFIINIYILFTLIIQAPTPSTYPPSLSTQRRLRRSIPWTDYLTMILSFCIELLHHGVYGFASHFMWFGGLTKTLLLLLDPKEKNHMARDRVISAQTACMPEGNSTVCEHFPQPVFQSNEAMRWSTVLKLSNTPKTPHYSGNQKALGVVQYDVFL